MVVLVIPHFATKFGIAKCAQQSAAHRVLDDVGRHERFLRRMHQVHVAPRRQHPVLAVQRHLIERGLLGGRQPAPDAQQAARCLRRHDAEAQPRAFRLRQRDQSVRVPTSKVGKSPGFSYSSILNGTASGHSAPPGYSGISMIFVRREVRVSEDPRRHGDRERFGEIRKRIAFAATRQIRSRRHQSSASGPFGIS